MQAIGYIRSGCRHLRCGTCGMGRRKGLGERLAEGRGRVAVGQPALDNIVRENSWCVREKLYEKRGECTGSTWPGFVSEPNNLTRCPLYSWMIFLYTLLSMFFCLTFIERWNSILDRNFDGKFSLAQIYIGN